MKTAKNKRIKTMLKYKTWTIFDTLEICGHFDSLP